MTAPRMILPATTYLVTRRCVGRQFLLRPDKAGTAQNIFEYCLAYAAKITGVSLHAYCVMSNHWHAVVSDPNCRLPEFMHHVNLMVGKCMNVYHGRFESLWSSEKYSAVSLEETDDVLRKIVYTVTNPVAAALVHSWSKWPGVISGPRSHLEGAKKVRRPKLFFRAKGSMPDEVELKVSMPAVLEGLTTAKEYGELLEMLIERRQQWLLAGHESEQRALLGRAGIFAQDPFGCPAGLDPRKGINPRVACKNKWGLREALRRLKSFLDAYRDAWRAYQDGDLTVVFPAGTYWMVHHLGAVGASPS